MSEHICLIRSEDERHTTFTKREEVVRCRDCEHYEQETVIDGETVGSWCDWMCMSRPQPDGFCAWGVRREP